MAVAIYPGHGTGPYPTAITAEIAELTTRQQQLEAAQQRLLTEQTGLQNQATGGNAEAQSQLQNVGAELAALPDQLNMVTSRIKSLNLLQDSPHGLNERFSE